MSPVYRALLGVVAAIAVVGVVGVVALWPDAGGRELPEANPAQTTRLLDATITGVETVAETDPAAELAGLSPGAETVALTVRLEEGGEALTFETIDDTGETYAPGQRVRVAEITSADQPTTYYVADFRRGRELAVLGLLFVGVVVAFGRRQGLRALLGLVLTFLVIVGFMVPAIVDGRSPVAVAVVGSLVIMVVTLSLSHGLGRKTTAAIVGTAGALLLTAVLAAVFVSAANLTGFSSEEARLANLEVGGLSLRGLLLAGIIVGGLGVLDDVTMAQASTVVELARSDPRATTRDLVRGALSVGRDHVAATVNTLFLAYAGAALPLLLLFVTGDDPLSTVLTSEIVAVEVVRTLVGSIGLIAAVPLTTALAAVLVADDRAAATAERGGHVHAPAAPRRGGHGRRGARVRGRPPADAAAEVGSGNHRSGDDRSGDDRTGDDGPVDAASAGWLDDGDDDQEWVNRLRDSYRLPPDEGGR